MAPWPDGLGARVLKECSSEIAPILASRLFKELYQMTGDRQTWAWCIRKVSNKMQLITDRCR